MPAAPSATLTRATFAKAELTRQAVVDAAHDIASQFGLEAISIGGIAERLGVSKSGVFARVGSREALILAVVDEASRRVAQQVMVPALKAPKGLPRLRAIFTSWVEWLTSGSAGCVMHAATIEYDDRPGPVRDAVVAQIRALRGNIARAVKMAVESGEFKSDVDPEQLAFELHGIAIAAHNELRLLGDKRASARAMLAFERVISTVLR
jgi:AcrR family transcriptional regulator